MIYNYYQRSEKSLEFTSLFYRLQNNEFREKSKFYFVFIAFGSERLRGDSDGKNDSLLQR
jgi:hypothetical protein